MNIMKMSPNKATFTTTPTNGSIHHREMGGVFTGGEGSRDQVVTPEMLVTDGRLQQATKVAPVSTRAPQRPQWIQPSP